ncbi:MAG: hypothetical protein FWF12_05630, partial [Betaproteobacteria bacterium]|nr:hypothetical protein [Betaproteobacteria bacterium]
GFQTRPCPFVGLQTMCQAMFWAGLKPAPAMPERSGIVQRVHKKLQNNKQVVKNFMESIVLILPQTHNQT